MVTQIINSAESIGDAYAPSLNAAFQELFDRFGFWPVVLAPYGGDRTPAQQHEVNPSQVVSDHVKQRAVDIDNHRRFRIINEALFLAILRKHGWLNVQVNGAPFPTEPWHFANQSTNPASGGTATLIQEEPLFAVLAVNGVGNDYTLLGVAGVVRHVTSATITLLKDRRLLVEIPTKVFATQADLNAALSSFPLVGAGGAGGTYTPGPVSDADVQRIAAEVIRQQKLPGN